MQALLTRSTAALLRRNGAAPGAAVALARGGDWPQQQRGLASERMVYGIKIPEGVKVSDPVRRVLSIDNSTMPQKKKLLKRLELEKWQRHAGDTGSPECQIAALTVRIDALRPLVNSTARMDFSCKRGYVKLLARRRKMLAYLKRKDFEIYRKVALETGLR
ncbi:unnamed protein product [Ectocarpus sp. CCAP 1310/34]|nr:unnamed protein product [Ectocarpus sp. CCAP 1310/34]